MKRKLKIIINAGETTCASLPGKFCKQVRVVGLKGNYLCQLFDKALYDEDQGVTGWLQRLPECLEAEKAEYGDAQVRFNRFQKKPKIQG
jgi:hypothetical protein